MATLKKMREDLEALKQEILARAQTSGKQAAADASAKIHETVDPQISELNRMVKTMLDEAETTIADHPVATVAGALALGIAIGRLTAR
jgi:ElaB/YqjD/DUF883 family membrane-anchored ribosome-binding protein